MFFWRERVLGRRRISKDDSFVIVLSSYEKFRLRKSINKEVGEVGVVIDEEVLGDEDREG